MTSEQSSKIEKNVSLKPYNTFGIDVKAKYFAEYTSIDELKSILQSDIAQENRIFHIGKGSNLLFLNDFDGLILHSDIKTIEKTDEDEASVLFRVGAGCVLDDFIDFCVDNQYFGLENLSLIPGEVGSAAVQNVGAYGMEASKRIEFVEFVELQSLKEQTFTRQACLYDYRNSIFKEELKGKAIITHVTFRLLKNADYVLDYDRLKESVLKRGEINLKNIRETIIEIRKSKLPDPQKTGNAGSFFKNPIVSKNQFEELHTAYPLMPFYPASNDRVKIPAGWLIDQCGLKGKRFFDGRVGIYEKQALVIVNYGGATGEEIASVASQAQNAVQEKFGIAIEPEVNYIS